MLCCFCKFDVWKKMQWIRSRVYPKPERIRQWIHLVFRYVYYSIHFIWVSRVPDQDHKPTQLTRWTTEIFMDLTEIFQNLPEIFIFNWKGDLTKTNVFDELRQDEPSSTVGIPNYKWKIFTIFNYQILGWKRSRPRTLLETSL